LCLFSGAPPSQLLYCAQSDRRAWEASTLLGSDGRDWLPLAVPALSTSACMVGNRRTCIRPRSVALGQGQGLAPTGTAASWTSTLCALEKGAVSVPPTSVVCGPSACSAYTATHHGLRCAPLYDERWTIGFGSGLWAVVRDIMVRRSAHITT
jgi:hypothetical protein